MLRCSLQIGGPLIHTVRSFGIWFIPSRLPYSLWILAGLTDPGNFKFHLEAEEARLGKNLRDVKYVIDGTDTLALITGGGRIEKVRVGNAIYTIHDSSRYSIVDRLPTLILADEALL